MSDRLYNVPANMKLAEEWKEVVLRSPEPDELTRAFTYVRNQAGRVRGLVLTRPAVPSASRFDLDSGLARLETLPENISIEIQVWPEEIPRLYLWRIMLRRFKTIIAIEAGTGFSKSVKDAARMGYLVGIDPASFTRKHRKELLAVARYYFHDKDLSVPIEPVHNLFRTWVRGKGADLQEVYREDLERFAYITEEGKQIASARWERIDRSHDTTPAVEKSDLFKQMEGCSVCAAFRICGAAPKCNLPLGDCDTVLALADLFRLEATTMAKQVRALLS